MNSDFNYKDFLVISPTNVDYKSLLKKETNVETKFNLDIPRSILGEIISRSAYQIEAKTRKNRFTNFKLNSKDFRVPVCSNTLKTIYGKEYKKGVDLLKSTIIFQYPYSEKNCYQYSLNDVTRKQELQIVKLSSGNTKTKGIIKRLKERNIITQKNAKIKFKPLIKFFDNKRLTIDINSAFRQLEAKYKVNKNYGQFIIDLQKVIDIHNGIYKIYHKPDTDARLHTNFANLRSNLREFLRYDEKKIVEFDLSNSVPFLLSSLLSGNILYPNSNILSPLLYDYSLMFHKSLKSLDIKEIELFQSKCLSGEIYSMFKGEFIEQELFFSLIDEWYQDDSGIHFFSEKEVDKKVKYGFLAMLNSENGTFEGFENSFKKVFPTIFELLKKMKNQFDYKKTSHFLLQYESDLMLNKIAKEFNRKMNGKVPILTIHDCVCTTIDNKDKLELFINSELKKLFKSPPKYKVNVW